MFGYIANIGIPSLILILIIALIVFGPGKLPGVGKALGESIHAVRQAIERSTALRRIRTPSRAGCRPLVEVEIT